MEFLENPIKSYAWGDSTAIPRLLGRSATGQPQAELWLGAHGSDASKRQSDAQPLDRVISANPLAALGQKSVERFGPTLPFLLKVLAAAKPLSLQAHPSLDQARAGFERENAQRVPLDAPARNYKDPNHKPELICALTPFHALCGFRAKAESIAFFTALGLPTGTLEQRGLAAYFEETMTAPREAQQALARRAAAACNRPVGYDVERGWGLQLAAQYPGDVGLIGALLLNAVTLQPGEALCLPAGNLHAYLQGVGIELMASSDNVLRGGLTPKHVDVPELLRVLDFSDGPVSIQRANDVGEYPTPAVDFELSRLDLATGTPLTLTRRGADILLCVGGELTVASATHAVTMKKGMSVFSPLIEGALTLSGVGELYRATIGRF